MGAWGVPGAAHRSTAEWLSCRHATESGLVVPCMGAAAGSVRTCPISRGPNPNPSPSSSPSPSPCPNPNPNPTQVQCADIGLMGGPAKKLNPETGKTMAVPGVQIFVGGRIGEDAHL